MSAQVLFEPTVRTLQFQETPKKPHKKKKDRELYAKKSITLRKRVRRFKSVKGKVPEYMEVCCREELGSIYYEV